VLAEPETKAIVEWTKQNRFTFSVSLWSDQRASNFPYSSMPDLHDGKYACTPVAASMFAAKLVLTPRLEI
jgi:hypothetical protein